MVEEIHPLETARLRPRMVMWSVGFSTFHLRIPNSSRVVLEAFQARMLSLGCGGQSYY